MFCAVCKVDLNDSTTEMEVSGKDGMVKVVNVPCAVCPSCNACVVDSLSAEVVRKAAKKSKDDTLDFDKMKGVGIMAGKISL